MRVRGVGGLLVVLLVGGAGGRAGGQRGSDGLQQVHGRLGRVRVGGEGGGVGKGGSPLGDRFLLFLLMVEGLAMAPVCK